MQESQRREKSARGQCLLPTPLWVRLHKGQLLQRPSRVREARPGTRSRGPFGTLFTVCGTGVPRVPADPLSSCPVCTLQAVDMAFQTLSRTSLHVNLCNKNVTLDLSLH